MSRTDKPVVWLHGEIKTPPFSPPARLEAGVLLRRLQAGEHRRLPQSRPMPAIGAACHELRIVDREVTWRIVYGLDAHAVVSNPGRRRQEDGGDAEGCRQEPSTTVG